MPLPVAVHGVGPATKEAYALSTQETDGWWSTARGLVPELVTWYTAIRSVGAAY